MKISREWATPLTIGAFGLMSVTGMLMFFHLDTGFNKLAHEWLMPNANARLDSVSADDRGLQAKAIGALFDAKSLGDAP